MRSDGLNCFTYDIICLMGIVHDITQTIDAALITNITTNASSTDASLPALNELTRICFTTQTRFLNGALTSVLVKLSLASE